MSTHVAIIDDHIFVAGLFHHARQFGHFIVGGHPARAVEKHDSALRELLLQALDQWSNRVVVSADAEDNFVFGIILTAETGEILIGARIDAADRLEDADGRGKIPLRAGRRLVEETPGTIYCNAIVDKRDCRNEKKQRLPGNRHRR